MGGRGREGERPALPKTLVVIIARGPRSPARGVGGNTHKKQSYSC